MHSKLVAGVLEGCHGCHAKQLYLDGATTPHSKLTGPVFERVAFEKVDHSTKNGTLGGGFIFFENFTPTRWEWNPIRLAHIFHMG